MDNQQSTEYTKKYQELQLLGRGNYGSAYVVRSILNGKLYVAKKMNLDGMTQAEIEGAKQQISILKKFSDSNQYLFIVKYIESFYFERTLIIVMEFCQYGDLATFLKHAKKKGQLLQQNVILAWFIMLIFGIQALHSKNVLHRDLKSANVFLTSNKYVKIGDFGISKVLDSTSAKTFVGTPYYLSPEVCSNKKYDLRSDLWSLGCILYELCTLNYPFQANNILSLAMKITTQEVAPISSKYSKQLNDIVSGLLTKDQNKRMSLISILEMPYIKKFMLEHRDDIDHICQKIPLKKSTKFEAVKNGEGTLQKQSQIKGSSDENEDTMQTIKSNFEKTTNNETLNNKSMKSDTLGYSMTDTGISPKDLMKMRKQQKIRQQHERLKQTQKEYSEARNFAKLKKQEQFGGSGSNFGKSANMDLKKSMERQCLERNKQAAEQKIRVNKGLDANQPINLEQLNTIREQTLKMNGLSLTKNNNSALTVDLTASVEKKIIGMNQNYKMYTQTVEEDIDHDENDEQLQEYYDEDFQSYDNNEEQKAQIENQQDAFKSYLKVFSGQKEQVSPSKLASVERAIQIKPVGIRSSPTERKEECVKKCINLVNKDRFKLLYELVSEGYVGQNYKQSEQLKQIRKKGSASQKQALRLIDLIKYLEMEEKGIK